MDYTLKVRCRLAILGKCDDNDCPHHNSHDFDRSCEPGHCEVAGTPTRCTEDYQASTEGIMIDDGVVLVQEGE